MSTYPAGTHRVQFGTASIVFDLVYANRKTLAVHVYPDCSVVVEAPLHTDFARIEQAVNKRSAWILRQQREYQSHRTDVTLPRSYVSGESYRYLGRQYRLKVIEDHVERMTLTRGYLTVGTHNPADTQRIGQLIHHWYLSRARRVFADCLAACFPRVAYLDVEFPALAVRLLKSRWGSCSATGRITLNLKIIQAPKSLIEYVLLHELCHLKELNHTANYYGLLDRVLPNWKRLRQQLNQFEFDVM